MHLAMASFCHLCGDSSDYLTNIFSETGKRDNLERLLDQYIIPIVCLSKDDRLCVCDTCKTRLLSWDLFIKSCMKAREKLDKKCFKGEQNGSGSKKRQTNDFEAALITQSSHKKRRSSNYCIARWCNKGNFQGVSLFRFPKDRDRALTWLAAAERPDMKSIATFNCYYLCANHFTPNMFTNKACNQLIKQAVPTLFPRPFYADKIAHKLASSQILPTQLQGVQLKSILPKTNSSKGTLSSQSLNCMNNTRKISKTKAESKNSSNSVLLNLLPQLVTKETPQPEGRTNFVMLHHEPSNNPDTSENVFHLLKSISSSSQNQNRSVLKMHDPGTDSNLYFSAAPSAIDQQSSSNYLNIFKCGTPSQPDFDISNLNQIKSESNAILVEASTILSEKNVLIEGNETNLESSLEKEQTQKKHLIEDLETCLANDTFTPTNLLPVHDNMQCPAQPNSTELKKNNFLVAEISELSTSSRNQDIQSQFMNQIDSFQTTAGSQDLLLAHVSDKINRPPSSFSEQTFALGSDVAADVSESAVSLCVLTEPSAITEVHPPHISLFGLQADEGSENSSFINNIENLDELMDLDHFFEGR